MNTLSQNVPWLHPQWPSALSLPPHRFNHLSLPLSCLPLPRYALSLSSLSPSLFSLSPSILYLYPPSLSSLSLTSLSRYPLSPSLCSLSTRPSPTDAPAITHTQTHIGSHTRAHAVASTERLSLQGKGETTITPPAPACPAWPLF